VSGYGCCDLSATGANASLEYLQSYFPGVRLITCRTNHPWPAHSPDLSFLDYFMWEYLKDRIYVNNPQTMMEIMRIPHEMLDTVIAKFNVRVAIVIQHQGAWIEHITNSIALYSQNGGLRRKKNVHPTNFRCL